VANGNNDLKANLLLERWATVLHSSPGAALIGPDGHSLRTWAEMEDEAERLRGALDGDGSPVALQVGNHPSLPSLLLACWRAGRAVCLLDSALGQPSRREMESRVGAGLRVESDGTGLTFAALESGRPSPDDIVLYKLTSGTTSLPQHLGFTAAEIVADCDHVCDSMGIGAADRNFGVIAFSHSYGFSNLITPLICRGVPLVVASDALPRAIQIGLENSRATVLPLVPAMFRALARMDSLPPTLRLCISAGAPLEVSVAREFHERFGHKIHSFYGASECGGICYDRSATLVHEPGFVGEPLVGVTIEWANDPQPSGSRVRVRSAAVGGAEFFEPSDLLVPVGSGFRLVGREADLINCAGKKIAPAEVERVLMTCPDICEAVVFGVERADGSDRIHALVVADRAINQTAIRTHCATQLAAWQIPREFHQVPEIPRTARGKINRRELAATFG